MLVWTRKADRKRERTLRNTNGKEGWHNRNRGVCSTLAILLADRKHHLRRHCAAHTCTSQHERISRPYVCLHAHQVFAALDFWGRVRERKKFGLLRTEKKTLKERSFIPSRDNRSPPQIINYVIASLRTSKSSIKGNCFPHVATKSLRILPGEIH